MISKKAWILISIAGLITGWFLTLISMVVGAGGFWNILGKWFSIFLLLLSLASIIRIAARD